MRTVCQVDLVKGQIVTKLAFRDDLIGKRRHTAHRVKVERARCCQVEFQRRAQGLT